MHVSDAEIRDRLATALGRPVAVLRRRPSPYGSRHPLEEVDAEVGDSEPLRLMLKAGAAREAAAYREILGPAALDVPAWYASSSNGRAWVLLERLDAVPLWQVGDFAAWEEAARWLARLHASPAPTTSVGAPAAAPAIAAYDAAHLRALPLRALAVLADGRPSRRRLVERLAANWQQVVERLAAWPVSLVHGDFYPSNVLVQACAGGPRVRPVDWELIGIGPGPLDLAALSSGRWTAGERERLARAYHDALPTSGRPAWAEFEDVLEQARLAIAVGWLGAPRDWVPPAEHRCNWMADAVESADRLGLL